MQRDEPTLAEGSDEALLRAGFGRGDDFAAVLRTGLRAPRARSRILALRGAQRQALLGATEWLAALADPRADVRRDALNLFAYADLTDRKVLDAVVARLDDEDPLVVDGAAFALGEHLWVEAVEALCRVATQHEDARCRESAVAALGTIGDDRARPVIFAALEDKAPVRRRAIVALSNFEGPDIDEALERAREDRDWQVRAAVDQLGRGED